MVVDMDLIVASVALLLFTLPFDFVNLPVAKLMLAFMFMFYVYVNVYVDVYVVVYAEVYVECTLLCC